MATKPTHTCIKVSYIMNMVRLLHVSATPVAIRREMQEWLKHVGGTLC